MVIYSNTHNLDYRQYILHFLSELTFGSKESESDVAKILLKVSSADYVDIYCVVVTGEISRQQLICASSNFARVSHHFGEYVELTKTFPP